jgi:hypothetical protein
MALLLNELKEKITKEFDVCLLCEFLDIEPEELVERFDDKLIDNIHKFKGLEDEKITK